MTITTGTLSAGTHTVTADVSDDAGNPHARLCDRNRRFGIQRVRGHRVALGKRLCFLLSARGIMKGETANGSTYFRPNRNLTRQEFAVTMARLLNLDTSSTSARSASPMRTVFRAGRARRSCPQFRVRTL